METNKPTTMKTAMQQLLLNLKQSRLYTNDSEVGEKEVYTAIIESIKRTYLPIEQTQIEDSYWKGGQDVPINPDRCKEYFTKTYEQ